MIDRDGPNTDMNFELAIDGIAGLEWRIGNGRRFALELNLGFGELHDLVIFAGWTLP